MIPMVGVAAPDFDLACVDARDESHRSIRLSDYAGRNPDEVLRVLDAFRTGGLSGPAANPT